MSMSALMESFYAPWKARRHGLNPNGTRVPVNRDGDRLLSIDSPVEELDTFQTHLEVPCPMLSEPDTSLRPRRISHIPCAVGLQEVFEDDSSVGYKIAFTPEKASDSE
jgi:hypothetical protein